MKNINFLFDQKKWEDIAMYPPEEIIKNLGFMNGMLVAYKLLYNEDWNEDLQEFAVKLLFNIKEKYSHEWDLNWRFDALLGLACDITLKYEERFEAYKRACEKAVKPPPELLIELARCCYCPGKPPISYEKSIELLKQSIMEHPYKQAASLLKGIYASKKDAENEEYWSKKMEQIKDENPPPLEPPFLRE